MDKLTKNIDKEWIDLNLENIDFNKCLLIKKKNNFFLQRSNLPCYLIYMEYIPNDLYSFILSKKKYQSMNGHVIYFK